MNRRSLSAKGRRNKGLVGERELAHAFREAGATRLHNLEGQGDHLVELNDVLFHVEGKRRERVEIMRWVRQAEAEAQAPYIPLVCFRQNGEPWRVVINLDIFLQLVGE